MKTPNNSSLSLFDPIIEAWFSKTFGSPTHIQSKAWPEIASGKHVLITAPTGSGKTLTAFLWAINQLLTGSWPNGQMRVLYISPLKALNNDVHKNLLKPLEALRECYEISEKDFVNIRVLTRSGDTPQEDRRRMLRHPPEILITTPESLNILISSKHGRKLFTGLTTVILDEIHAVVGNKRGVHLMSAVDRLVLLSGEFQRIALSATVKPQDKIAEFIGGYQLEGSLLDPVYKKRPIAILKSDEQKNIEASIRFTGGAKNKKDSDSIWKLMVEAFKENIHKNRSTLLFANSRRTTEKVARFINENEMEDLAYSHHGSLSKEIRLTVEEKLKNGELKAIVATNSLELGIDIGDLDQVLLIQCPFSVSSAIQRIGRSGHGVGETSSGIIFPTHGRDLINSAVMARCIQEKDIEPIKPITCPLDVLAQVILAMTMVEIWDIDELYGFIKTNTSFHNLSRRQFDLVLEMLAGRYADTRIRELKPRITIDKIDNTVKAKAGTAMLVYMAGGTIPDRGLYNLRFQENRSKIGELDEEFVWERRVGETFAMGAQTWRIQQITHNDVDVVPVESRPGIIPFWRAETRNRDFHFSQKIAHFLEEAELSIINSEDIFREKLCDEYAMDENSALNLIEFLKHQKEVTGISLPHRYHLVIEHFDDPFNKADSKQVILHTLWGGRINRPLAMAMAAAWEEKYKYPLEIFADNDCISLLLPHALEATDILNLVTADNVEVLLRKQLERTGFFGAMFRENAGRALLLPKTNIHKRMPLWLNRLRSKKLLDAVIKAEDFPIILETWRSCIQDEFDLENLKILLEEVLNGQIRISQTITQSASPFSQGLIWQQTNKYMYEDDTPSPGERSGISDDLFREVTGAAHLRPRIAIELIKDLEQKLQRTAPGYSPGTSEDLLDWVKERILIPEKEWINLLSSMNDEHEIESKDIISQVSNKLVMLTLPEAELKTVCAVEILPQITDAFSLDKENLPINSLTPDIDESALKKHIDIVFHDLRSIPNESEDREDKKTAQEIIGQWLVYYGPVDDLFINRIFGLQEEVLHEILHSFQEEDQIVIDLLSIESQYPEICNRDNLEILLRMARRERQPAFQPLPIQQLQLFLADFQGLTQPGDSIEDLQQNLEQLFGFCAPASAWEESIFPSRMMPYFTSWLDSLMQSSELNWFGCGDKRTSFAFAEDLELFLDSNEPNTEDLLPAKEGRYSFFDIINHSNMNSGDAVKRIWEAAWQGKLTNDTFAVLREGILNKFKPLQLKNNPRQSKRGQFNRWKSSRPLVGNWYVLNTGDDESDLVEELEIRKDRIRQLFRRYGILFRSILVRELQPLQWSSIFRELRLMELSGEILSGYFFEGIPGLQFISHEAFRHLTRSLPEDRIYWMNATDPASLCGVKINGLNTSYPSRLISTFIVFHGPELVMILKRNGKVLEIMVPPDSPYIIEYLSIFKVLLGRQFNPPRSIEVVLINDENAALSPYASVLKAFGFTKDYRILELRRQF